LCLLPAGTWQSCCFDSVFFLTMTTTWRQILYLIHPAPLPLPHDGTDGLFMMSKQSQCPIAYACAQASNSTHWKFCRVKAQRARKGGRCCCRELQAMMATSQIVVTCGGLGPTVDDITVEAVGVAVGAHVAPDSVLSASICKHFGDKVWRALSIIAPLLSLWKRIIGQVL
jgi:hypothetical protein